MTVETMKALSPKEMDAYVKQTMEELHKREIDLLVSELEVEALQYANELQNEDKSDYEIIDYLSQIMIYKDVAFVKEGFKNNIYVDNTLNTAIDTVDSKELNDIAMYLGLNGKEELVSYRLKVETFEAA